MLSADLVAPMLNFLAELAWRAEMKNWLGGPEGNIFWPALLSMLCSQSSGYTNMHQRQSSLTIQQRAAVETATIKLLSRCIVCHATNQYLLAEVLCDVLRTQVDTGKITNLFHKLC